MSSRRSVLGSLLAVSAASLAGPGQAQQGQAVKLAWIDPLSGPFAHLGQNSLKTFQLVAQHLNARNPPGARLEIVPFDNKVSPQESLTLLKSVIDQGIRYVVQGNGSAVAGALIDAINKHNQRNPGQEIVFLNYAAVDPDFTNSKCSFWHFRFDADTSMKMEAYTTYLRSQKDVRAVYLLNQNYSHGHQVARYFKDGLARKRPDVRIAGEDLIPLGQVKDFAPYIAKIKASGADSVVTGNWGADLALLIKAAKDAGLDATFYTYYANAADTPTAIGAHMAGKVKVVYIGHPNLAGLRPLMREFRARYGEDLSLLGPLHLLPVLTAAMARAGSTDPVKVASALEGLSIKSFSGEVTMRAADHQLQQPLYVMSWQRISQPRTQYDVEGTGFTWVQEQVFEPYVSSTPTSCQMKRPG